jgi:hypothetical protein
MYIKHYHDFPFDRRQKDPPEVSSGNKNQLGRMARLQITVLSLDRQ